MAQFSPNVIRLILWFIAACEERGLQPTFKAFFTIFYVKKSNMYPFYELLQCNKSLKLGSLLTPFKPVLCPDSMKNWPFEYIMLRGGEWDFMSGFTEDAKPTYRVPRKVLTASILESLVALVKTFEKPWPKSHFFSLKNLKACHSKYPMYFSYCLGGFV